ncbi:DNA/RNA non-specific endonuclease [Marisediminicola senii]|uniref:DNA/RNA non-specific endonuclease n=1 Tax=Marisediminicola senii TaxID=2711233 RepID=UPI0013ED7F79|nr:DNA/RNA non-specific endonuclease [Marisediminicola senii]
MSSGYDPDFLGLPVALPASSTPADQLARLDYRHFTVVLHRRRRLAELTSVNIDGDNLVDVGRGDDWHLDERVPADEQAGPELYARNDLDRGHLVRRRDPVWGPDADEANYDTFSYANAAPQVNSFNQSKELWLGLEDYLLDHADATGRRLTVLTGPVFDDADPKYRGIQLPRKFFKVAVWVMDDAAAATAYLLDQGALLDRLTLPAAWAVDDPPELGPFRTFQLAVSEVSRLTGLDLAQLEAVDRFAPRPGLLRSDWTLLESAADIRL